ncbi:MAG TPA: DUF6171 family protein [Treponemataceae bacterium]|nr:DUF6171 family protein [Treponemataceae bacterium]
MPCISCGHTEIPSFEELERIAGELLAGTEFISLDAGALGPSFRHQRIAACRTCEYLRFDVMCSWCGCFVQIRSLNPDQICPDPAGSRWSGE